MKTELDQSERQFLEQLQRLGAGTIQEIGDAVGVTATAVRQRLTRLQDLGYVARDLERAGRGRPHHRYRITDKGMRQLGDNYSDLALILWREIRSINDPQVQQLLRRRVRDALVARFGSVESIPLVWDRLTHLKSELSDRGYSVEIDQAAGLPILRENNCPFHELAETDREICELEQDVFERVLGVPVKLTKCCQDDHTCCEFEIGEREDRRPPAVMH